MYTVTEGDPPANISVNVTLIATRGCEDEYTVNVTALDGSALGETAPLYLSPSYDNFVLSVCGIFPVLVFQGPSPVGARYTDIWNFTIALKLNYSHLHF